MPLQGLTVVVTRPEAQAARFRQLLAANGADVLALPLLEIRLPDDPAKVQRILARLSDYDAAIFISSNAVQYGLALLDDRQRKTLQSLTLGAIGNKTAQALKAQGLSVQWVPPAAFTSEAFLALPAVQSLAGRQILIFRGQGGRELLADTLRNRGATVDYADVYQRTCPLVDPAVLAMLKQHHQQQRLDIIAVTSSEGVSNLRGVLPEESWSRQVALLLGSERMAATARQAGFAGPLIVADDPGDEAMLAALAQWVRKQQT